MKIIWLLKLLNYENYLVLKNYLDFTKLLVRKNYWIVKTIELLKLLNYENYLVLENYLDFTKLLVRKNYWIKKLLNYGNYLCYKNYLMGLEYVCHIPESQRLVIFSISRFAMQNLKIISLFLFQTDCNNWGDICNIAFCNAKHKNNEIIFIRVRLPYTLIFSLVIFL